MFQKYVQEFDSVDADFGEDVCECGSGEEEKHGCMGLQVVLQGWSESSNLRYNAHSLLGSREGTS